MIDKAKIFIRFALIIEVICLITIFMVKPNTLEFYLTLASLIICLVIIIVGAILIRRRKE